MQVLTAEINTYDQLLEHVVREALPVHNQTNNVMTYVVPNVVAILKPDIFPICTTRKSYWKSAIREFVCYLRGYDRLEQFQAMGVKTWDNNGLNPNWLDSPYCSEEGDLGRIYGVQMRNWQNTENINYDQLTKVIHNLKRGIDDRGEIITMWNPGEHHMGCLRPCMYSHTFSLVNGTLHLASVQRSADVPLGSNYNLVQAWFFLWWVSTVTGHKQGDVTLLMNNAHIYDNQLELAKEQIERVPYVSPNFITSGLHPIAWQHLVLDTHDDPTEHMLLDGYEYHPPIDYPFTTTAGVKA